MPTCFVIMPISTPPDVKAYEGPNHFQRALDELHAPAIVRAGYEVIPPIVENSEVIHAEIIKNLAAADLVVCDLSTLNPNVIFELGIRVALDRPVAMIKDDLTREIPFDNQIVSCFTYSSALRSWNVRDETPLLAKWVERAGLQKRNALWRHFGPAVHPTSEFDAAVRQLLKAGGLAGRWSDYDLGVDPPRRTVRLTLADLPGDYLQTVLRKRAAELGLRLEFAVRLTPRMR